MPSRKVVNNNKTEQLLAYLAKNHPGSTVTSIMKLAYLVDLVSVKRTGKQVSNFEYRRYNFGPFDKKIYGYLDNLTNTKAITPHTEFSPRGDEYVVYSFNEASSTVFSFEKLSSEEIKIADEVLDNVRGYGAKVLTEMAYHTKPMKKIGATRGGSENLNKLLDLDV